MKKQWQKPELTVLVRTRPEEAVLAACKIANKTGSGAEALDSGCTYDATCGACSPLGTS